MHAVSLRIARCLNGRVSVLLLLAVAFATAAVWRNQESRAQERDARQASDVQAEEKIAAVVTTHTGRLVRVFVESGQSVEKGQILYEIMIDGSFLEKLHSLKSELKTAERQLESLSMEIEAGLNPGVNLADFQRRVYVLRQHNEDLLQIKESLFIRSPIDGFVVAPRRQVLEFHPMINAGSLIAIVTKEKPDEKTREKLRGMLDVKEVKVTRNEPDSRQTSDASADTETTVVVAPLAGMVGKAFVEPGDAVEKGQKLYRLSDYRLESELMQVKPELRAADVELEALTKFKQGGFRDDLNLASFQQRSEILRQRREVLEQLIESLTIRSPIDGFIVAPRGPLENNVHVKAGSLIAIVTKEKPDEKTREKLRGMLDVKGVKVTRVDEKTTFIQPIE